METPNTLQFFSALLQAAGPKPRIPVRVDSSFMGDGRQHYMRGNLTGIRGSKVIVCPLHGKNKEMDVPPAAVKLWGSRLPSNVATLADKIKQEQVEQALKAIEPPKGDVKSLINNPLFQVDKGKTGPSITAKEEPLKETVKASISPIAIPAPAVSSTPELSKVGSILVQKGGNENTAKQVTESLMEVAKSSPPVTVIPVEPIVEPIAPQPVASQPQGYAVKLKSFREQMEELERKKAEIEREAREAGVLRLRNLFEDLEEAKKMVSAVEGDIVLAVQELNEFNISIPDDLKAKLLESQQMPVSDRKVQTPIKLEDQTSPVSTGWERRKPSLVQRPIENSEPAGLWRDEKQEDTEAADDEVPQGDPGIIEQTRRDMARLQQMPEADSRRIGRTEKPRIYKPMIVKYFQDNENMFTSGQELMRICNETVSPPSDVLTPLVADGTLEKLGVRSNIRYRLKTEVK